ncbi:MAG: phage tail family protein [Oscillospiraceae bacterium]|nr:phage tail family protein [Oscillospiraceae bacterium]
MNYIIWNGINSNTIKDLIIQELPPITKPPIRTDVFEIEGRDGDIIEQNGYSAYDKEILIGITQNANIANINDTESIDRIFEYFKGTGQVTFSNEPDKYYNAQIFDEISAERLVKFRQASVIFHTQPFKYLANEPIVDVTIDQQKIDRQTEKQSDDQKTKEQQTEINITNQGLELSKPVITLYGTNIVEISINTIGTFQLNFSVNPDLPDEYLTVNSEIEECYKDTIKTLKNRSMAGEFPVLNPGENIIAWTGNLKRIVIEPRSRWL